MADTPKGYFAVAYSLHGARVFPLHSILPDGQCSCGKNECRDNPKGRGKHPLHKGWQEEATADQGAIMQLWARTPDANVGIACGKGSNLTVVDVDGTVGLEQLHELESKYGKLPPTPRTITGSGGYHLLFEYQEGPNNAVTWAPGLDIRTEGGLIVGAGSRNALGEYIFEAGYSLGDLPRAKMPSWLVGRIKEGQEKKGNSSNGTGFKIPERPGAEGAGRNDLLYRAGRSMKAKGFGADAIRGALEATNRERCSPSVGEDELKTILKSVSSQHDDPNFKGTQSNSLEAFLGFLGLERVRTKLTSF